MKRILPHAACALALLACSVSVDAITAPAAAQADFEIGFTTFHDRLANYGDWVYSDRWGEVWIPADVPDDFRPYDTDGHWAYTDEYGWYWASDYAWGDVAFHYGRWVNDPDDGWLWIPGYVWSPAWVAWRSNGNYIGWMALPPDDAFLGRGEPGYGEGRVTIAIDFNDVGGFYGYSRWYGRDYDQDRFAANWVFVPTGHVADRDFHRFVAPRANYVNIISNTTNITNYTVVNNYVVNRSVDVNLVQRAGGHPVVAVRAAEVIRDPKLVVRADTGRQIQMRVRTENPHGTGLANSAPAPTQKVVESLSTNVRVHRVNAVAGAGQPPRHLFTRTTITSSPLAPRGGGAAGAEGAGASGGGQGSAMQGPTMQGPTEKHHHANGSETPGNGAASGPGGAMNGPSEAQHLGHENNGAMGAGSGNGAAEGSAGGTTNGPSEALRHRHENNGTAGAAGGSGMTEGPSGGTTNGPSEALRHHHENNGTAGAGGANGVTEGSSGGTMNGPSEAQRHRHENNGVVGTDNGNGAAEGAAGGTANGQATFERHHPENANATGRGNGSGQAQGLSGAAMYEQSGHRHQPGSGAAANGNGAAPQEPSHANQPPAPGDNGNSGEKHHRDNGGKDNGDSGHN